jgi:exosortase
MQTAPAAATLAPSWLGRAALFCGLGAFLIPSYLDVHAVFWRQERGAQGPIILAIVAALVWRERAVLRRWSAGRPAWPGAVLLGAGLLVHVLARSQSIYSIEIVAQIPVLLGIVWLLWGREGLRRLWFPIALLAFAVPIPGSLLDQVLMPLKDWVSATVDTVLHTLGYPIARNGVMLVIGPYRLLIADACSGLNSMVALSGVGLLYVYLVGHQSRARNVLLLASILPIAFLANIVRVLLLVLIAYYQGEAASRTFHDHAGLLEVLLAFGAFFLFDGLLGWAATWLRAPHKAAAPAKPALATAGVAR